MTNKYLMVLGFILVISGCRLEIEVPEGGKVVTQSGNFECLAGETCVIEVTDASFDETFIAMPDNGYSFRWRKIPGAFCGGNQANCRLTTAPLAGNSALLAVLQNDFALYLKPKFWTADQPEVSGVGSGTIDGFGSVIINGDTTLSSDDSTTVTIDDELVDDSELRLGMVVDFEVGEDTAADLGTATAISIAANNLVKGPVTSVSPLTVLSQTVVVTGSTILEDLPAGQLSSLSPGDIVEVSGHRGEAGEILATRLEYKPVGVELWKLTGTVSSLVAGSQFEIFGQPVSMVGAVIDDCDAGLSNGNVVEVKANPSVQFMPGGALESVTKIECLQAGLPLPDNAIGFRLPAEIEGLVGSSPSPMQFTLGGQLVEWTSATEFRGGTPEDIVDGVRLEAEGTLNTETDVLLAREIKFKQRRVRIEAPLDSGAAGSGNSIELLGIEVLATAITDDEDSVLSGSGGLQVEVRGYVDDAGSVIAEEVRDRGDSDIEDTRLRGPVSDIMPPTFRILGVLVDTSTAREIRNASEMLIGSAEFFGLIEEGSIVSVQDAIYDGSSRLDQGKIEVED